MKFLKWLRCKIIGHGKFMIDGYGIVYRCPHCGYEYKSPGYDAVMKILKAREN